MLVLLEISAPKHKLKENELQQIHDHSYNLAVSHYRRMHVPHRQYLPSELDVKTMYRDFKFKKHHPSISYDTYLNNIHKLNISFAKLGSECEQCLEQLVLGNPTLYPGHYV